MRHLLSSSYLLLGLSVLTAFGQQAQVPVMETPTGERLFVVGPREAPSPPPGRVRSWGEQSGPFRLSITSDKDQYAPGEAMRVVAVIKNVSDHPTYLARSAPFLFYDVAIRLPVPEWVPWHPRAPLTPLGETEKHPRMASYSGAAVAAGNETVDEFELDKLYQMSAPGEYHITFSCKLPAHYRGDPKVTVTSNEIVVTVVRQRQ